MLISYILGVDISVADVKLYENYSIKITCFYDVLSLQIVIEIENKQKETSK